MTTPPRITFGIIVFNGEPFTRYCLRQLYPFAHQIIVVEGACPGASEMATDNGHSTDGTLEVLREFKENEDTENKIEIISRDGFWEEKDEQSQAYAERATGNYLWQVDIDEFYRSRHIQAVVNMLTEDPSIDAVSFRMLTFWGSTDYLTDGWFLRNGMNEFHRLFRWKPGYRYISHRPPTVVDECGTDVRKLHWLSAKDLEKNGIYLYHYSLLFPKQVFDKCRYYQNTFPERPHDLRWAKNTYMKLKNPFHVHNVYYIPSWLERYHGEKPGQVLKMMADIKHGAVPILLRQTDDIERLLNNRSYRWKREIVKRAIFLDSHYRTARNYFLILRRLIFHLIQRFTGTNPSKKT